MTMLQSLARAFTRPVADPAIAGLYQSCVEQARNEVFYSRLDVPDTIDGRFDLLLLHVYLVMRRMGDMEAKQELFDLMFKDMDRSLREMGVGDMGIGKRIKPMISAFYGRAQAYENALAENDQVLGGVLARNLYGKATPSADVLESITAYVRRAVASLEKQSQENILNGRVEFAACFLPPGGGG